MLTRLAVTAAVLLGLLGLLITFIPRIREGQRAKDELVHLKQAVKALEFKRETLQQAKVLLETSPEYNEMASRDRLNMKRAGETIFRFKEPNAPAAQ
jgi:cell division protein FtsB